ncbi:peptidase S8/S53 domain-containing protein, partial [Thamnocephalis sphaerospora]
NGTVVGSRYGVAKKAKIVAVKVQRSNGTVIMSDVIRGLEWVGEAHKTIKQKDERTVSATNIPLSNSHSSAFDAAVDATVNFGVHFAVAAGNDDSDACNYSPALAKKAVTVGASTLTDKRTPFSNYSRRVDVFARGLHIQSTWIGSNTAAKVTSSTSMASARVRGLMAYLLSLKDKPQSVTPKEPKEEIIKLSTTDALSDILSGTENRLAFNDPPSAINKAGWLIWMVRFVDRFTVSA